MEPAGVSRPCTWQMRPCSSAHGGGRGGGLQGTCILSCGCRAELFGLQAFCKCQEICL